MRYCTIICDIKNSKCLNHREDIQYKIIEMLKITNNKFKEIIISPFVITAGDEWEGLLEYPSNYMNIIKFFNSFVPEIKFYSGVGIGNLSIIDPKLTTNQLYGSTFYRARDAINYAKKNNLPLVVLANGWEDIY